MRLFLAGSILGVLALVLLVDARQRSARPLLLVFPGGERVRPAPEA